MSLVVRTFRPKDLAEAAALLREAFERPESDSAYNEWTFAERLLMDQEGYHEPLCLVAEDEGRIVGYSALTTAWIGGSKGLALGPLAVAAGRRGQGIGKALVEESVRRAAFPWVLVLGGGYYARYGFEPALPLGIMLVPGHPENEYLQIRFLDSQARGNITRTVRYCNTFYNADGELL